MERLIYLYDRSIQLENKIQFKLDQSKDSCDTHLVGLCACLMSAFLFWSIYGVVAYLCTETLLLSLSNRILFWICVSFLSLVLLLVCVCCLAVRFSWTFCSQKLFACTVFLCTPYRKFICCYPRKARFVLTLGTDDNHLLISELLAIREEFQYLIWLNKIQIKQQKEPVIDIETKNDLLGIQKELKHQQLVLNTKIKELNEIKLTLVDIVPNEIKQLISDFYFCDENVLEIDLN